MALIGMNEIVEELDKYGIKANYEYVRDLGLYRIIATKGSNWVSRKVRPFDLKYSDEVYNAERRGVIDAIIKAFELYEKKNNVDTMHVLSVGEMCDEIKKLGFETDYKLDSLQNKIIIIATIDNYHVASKTFRYVNSRNNDPSLTESYAFERRFVLEDLINRCLEIKKERDRKLYISTADYRPHTIFETLIKEKEKEMSNNINWRVTDITLDRRFGEAPVFEARVKGTMNGVVVGDINDIHAKLQKKLNAPENYVDTDSIRYSAADVAMTQAMYHSISRKFGLESSTKLPKIKKVIFNNPATIVIWADETKTVVKAQNDEIFDPEKGLAMAITKKALGNEGNYFDTIKKHVTEYQDSVAVKKLTVDISVDGFKEAANKIKKLGEALSQSNAKMAAHDARNALRNVLDDRKATKADLIEAIELATRYLNKGLDT